MVSIRIRAASPADAGPMARVHVHTWRTAYSGIVSADYLASLSYKDGQSMWDDILSTDRPATSTLVAEAGGGEIIGFAGGGPERQGDPTHLGEIYAVYVLQDHQRRGVGRRLVMAVARQLLRDGFVSMLLWGARGQPSCLPVLRVAGRRAGRASDHHDWRYRPHGGFLRLEGHRRPGDRACHHGITPTRRLWPPDALRAIPGSLGSASRQRGCRARRRP